MVILRNYYEKCFFFVYFEEIKRDLTSRDNRGVDYEVIKRDLKKTLFIMNRYRFIIMNSDLKKTLIIMNRPKSSLFIIMKR